MIKRVFLTYNKPDEMGYHTAMRMSVITKAYDIEAIVPSRFYQPLIELSNETKRRIDLCNIVLAFSTERLTKHMKAELNYAILQKKRVVIIYDKRKATGRINAGNNPLVKEIEFDFSQQDEALHQIAEFLKNTGPHKKQQSESNEKALALIGIGLGLLALWGLSKSK